MQELEKILEEIDQEKKNAALSIRHTTGYKAGQIRMAERIEEIIRKHMNNGWIPVEERLPIPNKEIWVTAKRNGNVFTSTDTMTEKGYFWNYEKENILAWKEKELIPEPYRPERSEVE